MRLELETVGLSQRDNGYLRALRGCLKSDEMCRLNRKGFAARHIRYGVPLKGYLFGMERRAEVVSVQTLRAELLWVVAGVGHEDQGL